MLMTLPIVEFSIQYLANRSVFHQLAYFVGVQIEGGYNNKQERQGFSPDMRQLSVVGAVKVAVRSSSLTAGSSK